MRSIIFSNYIARDVRRLGATIDVEHSHAKFMGNLTLNLWDCGGQDAFTESYLNSQRESVFGEVSVLIYVFDIESREVDRDIETYASVVEALREFSPSASVFVLVHKMDLVQFELRKTIYEERVKMVAGVSEGVRLETFASSIWDQTLYKAWAGIVHTMVPGLAVIEGFLKRFARQVEAEEVVLFERSTFLMVTSVSGGEEEDGNPNPDRYERISNIMKSYKHAIARNTRTTAASVGFVLFKVQTPTFNAFLARFTENTYIYVVIPPGEASFNCAVLNTMMAREAFGRTTRVEG